MLDLVSECRFFFEVCNWEEIVANSGVKEALGITVVAACLVFGATQNVRAQEPKNEGAQAAKPDKPTPNGPGGGPAADAQPATNSNLKLPSDYRVGAEDELQVQVWHEPELSQAVVVRPDGLITLPLLNDIKVSGLTTDEMQALLTEKLKTVVNDPQVTVIVKAVHSRKVFAVGNVMKQGVYALGGKKSVLELLAEAGGLGPFAKSGSIYILRKADGKETRIPFNYKKALKGKSDNPDLLPGDMVVVP